VTTGGEQRSRQTGKTVSAKTDDAYCRVSREHRGVNVDEEIVLETDDLQGLPADQRVVIESGYDCAECYGNQIIVIALTTKTTMAC